MIKKENSGINSITIGATDVQFVYIGTELVWQKIDPALAAAIAVTNAWADAVEATTEERAGAIVFTEQLFAAGIYFKIIGSWPYVGSDFSKQMRNFVDPADSDDAFRLTPVGSITTHVKGVQTPGGIADYMQTHIIPEMMGGGPLVGGSAYMQSASNYFQYTGSGTRWHLLHYDAGSDAAFPRIGTTVSSAEPIAGGNNAGHWAQQRPDLTKCETWSNGVLRATNDAPEDAFDAPDNQQVILVLGTAGVISYQSIFRAMTPTEMADYDTAVQNFMTALNRHV